MHKQVASDRFGCRTNISFDRKAFIGDKEVSYTAAKEAEGFGFPIDGVSIVRYVKCNIRFQGIGDMKINSLEELEALLACITALSTSSVVSDEVVATLVSQPHVKFTTAVSVVKDIEVVTEDGEQFVIPAAVAAKELYSVIPESFKTTGNRITHLMTRAVSMTPKGELRLNTCEGEASAYIGFLERTIEAYKEATLALDTEDTTD